MVRLRPLSPDQWVAGVNIHCCSRSLLFSSEEVATGCQWRSLPMLVRGLQLAGVSWPGEAWSTLTYRSSCSECPSSSFGRERGTELQGGERPVVKSGWRSWLAEAIRLVDQPEVLQDRWRCVRPILSSEGNGLDYPSADIHQAI